MLESKTIQSYQLLTAGCQLIITQLNNLHARNLTFVAPENRHPKRKLIFQPSFSGAMLNFGGVSCFSDPRVYEALNL